MYPIPSELGRSLVVAQNVIELVAPEQVTDQMCERIREK